MGLLTDIAAATKPTERLVPVNGVDPVPLALANSQRYSIGFSAPSGSPAVCTTDPNQTPSAGFNPPTNGIEWITVKDHGALAQLAWFGLPTGVFAAVVVWEIVFPKDG